MKPKIMLSCYRNGYGVGFNNAMDGKDKNYDDFPEGKTSVSINAYESYVNGYDHGYLDGLRKKLQNIKNKK
jgi:hypothetical protein